ncbi:hypothetical protein [Dentiradicibacter hellwigii]|uniref:Uncharacterized protein n=1 Tax=Dentiradicibacter hellwigii TaxID=3149053 RepID=A0ABV4UFD0_9RHOO
MKKIFHLLLAHITLLLILLFKEILTPFFNPETGKWVALVFFIIIMGMAPISGYLVTIPGMPSRDHSKISFYLCVIIFYIISIFLIALLIFVKEKIFFRNYLFFLLLSWLLNMFDYSIPSYKRYYRLIKERKWGKYLSC